MIFYHVGSLDKPHCGFPLIVPAFVRRLDSRCRGNGMFSRLLTFLVVILAEAGILLCHLTVIINRGRPGSVVAAHYKQTRQNSFHHMRRLVASIWHPVLHYSTIPLLHYSISPILPFPSCFIILLRIFMLVNSRKVISFL